MSKKDSSFLDAIFTAGAIIGGGWLIVEMLKAFGKQKTVYKCPNCKSEIEYHSNPCSKCGATIKWKV